MRHRLGLTAAVAVMATIFILLFVLLVVASSHRFRGGVAELGGWEVAEAQPKERAWIGAYAYNVSLCKLLVLRGALTLNNTLGNVTVPSANLTAPTKILILNEGEPVEIDHLLVLALGKRVYEKEVGKELMPGEYLVYKPSDLNLPNSLEALMLMKPVIILHTRQGEMIALSLAYHPPTPVSVVEVYGNGTCREP